jgi:imidazolonepropionase-like amidohydrolase
MRFSTARRPALLAVFVSFPLLALTQQLLPTPADIVIKNATVMTASHGTIEHGSVWMHNGKIAGIGATVEAPASAAVVDAAGM